MKLAEVPKAKELLEGLGTLDHYHNGPDGYVVVLQHRNKHRYEFSSIRQIEQFKQLEVGRP